MMRKFLLQIGKYFETVISYGGDKKVIRTSKENLYCEQVKKFAFFTCPDLGIVRLNINYCFVCGRKLER